MSRLFAFACASVGCAIGALLFGGTFREWAGAVYWIGAGLLVHWWTNRRSA